MNRALFCGIRSGWVCGMLAMAACAGGSNNTSTSDPTVTSSDEFCASAATFICAKYASCCAEVLLPMNETKCRSDVVSKCTSAAQTNMRNGFVFDTEAGAQCTAYFERFYHGCREVNPGTEVNDACDNLWWGTAGIGGACTLTRQCAQREGSIVDCPSDGPTKHTCTIRKIAGPNETCGQIGPGTMYGSYIDCQKQDYYCKVPTGSTTGLCAPRGHTGDDCSLNGTFGCADGFYCTAGTRLCAAPADPGSVCEDRVDWSCNANSYCYQNLCHASPDVGQACILGAGLYACREGLLCDSVSRLCIVSRAIGEACTSSDQCLSMSCGVDQKCAYYGIATAAACANPVPGAPF